MARLIMLTRISGLSFSTGQAGPGGGAAITVRAEAFPMAAELLAAGALTAEAAMVGDTEVDDCGRQLAGPTVSEFGCSRSDGDC
jgi:hypothetical protein